MQMHLIQLQQPKSNPMNESSHKLICEPTKQMDLDAELPNSLSPKKTQVTYSESKQDADLPCKIIDSTDTQICWLCHTSEKTNGCQQLPHSVNSERGRLASLLLSGHKSVGIQPLSLCLTNNLQQSRSFIDDVLIDWWQCQINKVDLKFLSSWGCGKAEHLEKRRSLVQKCLIFSDR
jgi:hypothetical protein